MKFCSLASGSSGNCYYIGNNNYGVLIDVGISAKAVENALIKIGVSIHSICAIFITHEHIDHIKGVKVLSKRYNIPVFASFGTWKLMQGLVLDNLANVLPSEGFMKVNDFSVSWLNILHDSADGVFYTVSFNEQKIGIMTDTGELPVGSVDFLYNCNILVMEANHDVKLLLNGPYPKFLQQRILSNEGHLSNEVCAKGIVKMMGVNTKHIVLAHLSESNNRPQIAYNTIKDILLKNCSTGRVKLWVAGKNCGEVLEI